MFIIGGLGVIGNILSIFVLLRKVCKNFYFLQITSEMNDDFSGQDLFQFSSGRSKHL